MRKAIVTLLVAALASTVVVTSAPREAQAQTTATPGRVNALPQGTIGTALLGAEAFMIIESVAGVHNRWVILGTSAIGLVGGGIGGFFIDRAIDGANGPGEISSALLIVGAGLVIPAVIAYANATMYRPEDSNQTADDNAGNAAPLEESTGHGAAAPATNGTAPAAGSSAAPGAFLNFSPGRMELGVPSLRIASSYSFEEMRQYGVAPRAEYHVPLLTAVF